MKTALAIVLLAFALDAAVPIVQNQYYRLPSGKNYFTVSHSTDATCATGLQFETRYTFNGNWARVAIRFQQDYNTVNTTVNSADPAEFCFNAAPYGGVRVVFREMDAGLNLVGNESVPLVVYPYTPTVQTGTITMPQELIGYPGLTKSQRLVVPGGSDMTGNTKMYFEVHGYSYNRKGSYRINNGRWKRFEDCLWQTTLATAIDADDLTIVVADGSSLPTSNFYITICAPSLDARTCEKIYIASRSGNTLTVAPAAGATIINNRGVPTNPGGGGTGAVRHAAAAHAVGDLVGHRTLQMEYGGVGGQSHTLKFVCEEPSAFVVGANQIDERYDAPVNKDDSRGFRIVAMNIRTAANVDLIPANDFAAEDPSGWTAPVGGDPIIGEDLFRTADLKTPSLPGYNNNAAVACGSCHSQGGWDIKYFNYSNNSIEVSSTFHGLTETQGKHIAAYIRGLTSPSPGRPWNPPYQPGPSVDAGTVANWAAGAGLTAVLNSDFEMFACMIDPVNCSGVISNASLITLFDETATLSARKTRIALQLPDWNHWLPRIHPIDYFGANFSGNVAFTNYAATRALTWGTCANANTNESALASWSNDFITWRNTHSQNVPYNNYTPTKGRAIYSANLWFISKMWEIHQEFGIEGCYSTVYPNTTESPAWGWIVLRTPFDSSPHISGIPHGGYLSITDELSGSLTTEVQGYSTQYTQHQYISMIWYQLQLILNSNTKEQTSQSPNDWSYTSDFNAIFGLYFSHPQAGLTTEWLIRTIQTFRNNSQAICGTACLGGYPMSIYDARFTHSSWDRYNWEGLTNTQIGYVIGGYLRALLDIAKVPSAADYYNATTGCGTPTGYGTATYRVVENVSSCYTFPDRYFMFLKVAKYYGVDATLLQEATDWGETYWPGPGGNLNNWDGINTVTCNRDSGQIACPNLQ